MSAKKVFISYSHDSKAHEKRLAGLAASLRRDGVDCRIDQYLPDGPPEGWPIWMEKTIEWADHVLVVCTENYLRRVRAETPPGEGRGVCWEARLIYQHLYNARLVNEKFIPVLYKEKHKDYIPTPLRAFHFYVLDGQAGYDRLFRRLTGQYTPMPILGKGLILETEVVGPSFAPSTSASKREPELPASFRYYLDRLTGETERLPLLGMGKSLQIDLPISQAYVPLRTTLTRSLQEETWEKFRKGTAEHEEDVDLASVFRKAERLAERGVILLGEPGAGKTTGARQMAWRLASGQNHPQDLGLPPATVPVFLKLRNLSSAALGSSNGLRVLLEKETRCDLAPDGLQNPGPDLWNRTEGLLWILDGLDEIIDASDRKRVAGWIRSLLKSRLNDRFLVTSRFQGYYTKGVPLGPEFVQFHVCPLDVKQSKQFVESWFRAAYSRLHGPGEEGERLAADQSRELLLRLEAPAHRSGAMLDLTTNPLMLTILCIVFHETNDLPRRRAELYSHCVKVLLEFWRRDLFKSDSGSGRDSIGAQAVLARLAWWMHQEQKRTTAALDDLALEAERGLAEISPSAGWGLDGAVFLERMRNEAGILALGGDAKGHCGFLHLSFQEYLAADYANREGLAAELAKNMTESWWREVGLLSLRHSRPFCEEFFRHLLDVGIAEDDPVLLGQCLEESLFPVPQPFLEVLARSTDARRVAAVLNQFRERPELVPGLREVVERLVRSKDSEIRAAAEEILLRLGVEPKRRDYGVSIDEKTGIAFVSIPPGDFKMGSEKGYADERPLHPVTITKGFLLGKYPVTNAQYRRFLEAGVGKMRKSEYLADRRFNQPEQPVVGLNWHEALAYCEWAGGRLPTEAEWEYACRAGAETEFSFGDDAKRLGDYGWFEGNSSGQTQPVGTKKANAWGLHDMHGNVWEWCSDWFSRSYYGESPETDPTGAERGPYRALRGGAWNYTPRFCRSACRYGRTPSDRINGLGFRVARDAAGKADR